MKKILLIFILFFLFSFSIKTSFAQQTPESTNSARADKQEYVLPYPGLLPDSPLYFLKAIRDRAINMLMSDPLKKADFNLLQADKRLNEGSMLFAKGEKKYNLAVTTISKGENYFDEAIKQITQAKAQGKDINSVTGRFYQSSFKHEEVIKQLENKAGEDIRQGLIIQEKRVKEFQKMVKALIP